MRQLAHKWELNMAQSQIRQPSQEELLRAFSAGNTPFDPTLAGKGIAAGEDLASTVLKNKQAQEDRVRQLAEKIAQAKKEQTFVQGVQKGPVVSSIIGKPITASETIQGVQPEDKQLGDIAAAYPKEVAAEKLKEILLNKSEKGKLERALLRQTQKNEQPDRIKQFGQIGDKVVGLTYGGKVQPIDLGGKSFDPLTKTLPAEQVEKTGTFTAMGDLIGRIRQDIVNPATGTLSAEGKDFLGPLDAPKQIAAGFTPAANPRATAFHEKLQDLKNQIIYLRSGKQINEQEYKRLRASLPSEYRDDSVFLSDLANFEKTFQDVASKRQEAFQQAGYKTPGNAPLTPVAGNPGKTGFRVIAVRPSGGK
jgi:hypothetical protein